MKWIVLIFSWVFFWPVKVANSWADSDEYNVDDEIMMVGSVALFFFGTIAWWALLFLTFGHFFICDVLFTCVYQ